MGKEDRRYCLQDLVILPVSPLGDNPSGDTAVWGGGA